MEITKNSVVSFDYTLRNDAGEIIDTSEGSEPLMYLHGHGNIVVGLEKAMEGKKTGDHFSATVTPEEGYGHSREELIQTVPRSAFEGVDNIEPGMQFQAESNVGPMNVVVTEVTEETVSVDGNHPLAGQTLNFVVEITDVRAATEDELSHGHAHGAGGHHHH